MKVLAVMVWQFENDPKRHGTKLIGMQLIGQAFEEEKLLGIANAYDRELQFGRKQPNL